MDITVSLVRRLIASQFPKWAHLPIKPVEMSGWDNRTFRLGEDMSVRLPSHKAYEAQVEKEQQWLQRLAPHLPLPIPNPLAMGKPSDEYPLHWSVYRWIDGENAAIERISDLDEFARALAQFLLALQQIESADGPPPGPHNFYRGGPVSTYDEETRNAFATLNGMIDTAAATEIWEYAMNAAWNGPPVWLHGDVHPTNLLVNDGQLSAVIDFGCSGVGDSACDFTIAWTFFRGHSRDTFKSHLHLDDATWLRARGWALWKGLITLADAATDSVKRREAKRVVDEIISEYKKL